MAFLRRPRFLLWKQTYAGVSQGFQGAVRLPALTFFCRSLAIFSIFIFLRPMLALVRFGEVARLLYFDYLILEC